MLVLLVSARAFLCAVADVRLRPSAVWCIAFIEEGGQAVVVAEWRGEGDGGSLKAAWLCRVGLVQTCGLVIKLTYNAIYSISQMIHPKS